MLVILFKSLVISLFCVGLRMVTDDGMILEAIRKPYVWLREKELNIWGEIILYLLTPIIGCVVCMSSVWTLLIDYYYFNCFGKWTILTIFVVASLNALIYSWFNKLNE